MSAATDELLDYAARAFRSPFAGVVVLQAEGEALIYVDGRHGAPKVTRDAAGLPTGGDGVSVWRGQRETLLRALESERHFAGAFVSGRLKIAGDMSVAARVSLGG